MAGIKKNFIYNVSYQLLNILLPLVTTPYLSRVLGPELVGVYSYTYSITYYFVLFATCGMSTYGVRAIARAMNDRAERSRVFWSAYIAQLLIGIVVYIAYILYTLLIHQGGIIISVIWGMYVLSALVDVSWLLFGCNDFIVPTIRSASVRIIQFIAVFVFVKGEDGLSAYILINSSGFLINQLLIWPFIKKHVDPHRPSWKEIRVHFLPNIRLFLPVIAVSLYTTLDKIMLGAMSNMEQAGYFEYAEKISRLPLTAITALGTVMLPKMSELIAVGNKEKVHELIEKSMWVMLLAAFAFAFGIMAVGKIFVPVYLGDEFLGAIPLMVLMSVIIPIISITNVIGKQYMLPSLMDSQYTLSLLLGAAVNVMINLMLIPRLAALGASLGTVAAESTVLIAQVVLVRKEIDFKRIVRVALPFLTIGLVMFAGVRLCSGFVVERLGVSLASLGVEVLIGAIVYALGVCIYVVVSRDKICLSLFPAVRRLKK